MRARPELREALGQPDRDVDERRAHGPRAREEHQRDADGVDRREDDVGAVEPRGATRGPSRSRRRSRPPPRAPRFSAAPATARHGAGRGRSRLCRTAQPALGELVHPVERVAGRRSPARARAPRAAAASRGRGRRRRSPAAAGKVGDCRPRPRRNMHRQTTKLLLPHEPRVHAPREPRLEGDRAPGHPRDVRAARPPPLEPLRAASASASRRRSWTTLQREHPRRGPASTGIAVRSFDELFSDGRAGRAIEEQRDRFVALDGGRPRRRRRARPGAPRQGVRRPAAELRRRARARGSVVQGRLLAPPARPRERVPRDVVEARVRRRLVLGARSPRRPSASRRSAGTATTTTSIC